MSGEASSRTPANWLFLSASRYLPPCKHAGHLTSQAVRADAPDPQIERDDWRPNVQGFLDHMMLRRFPPFSPVFGKGLYDCAFSSVEEIGIFWHFALYSILLW